MQFGTMPSLDASPYSAPAFLPLPEAREAGAVVRALREAWRRMWRRPWVALGAFLAVQLPLEALLFWLKGRFFVPGGTWAFLPVEFTLQIGLGSLATAALISAAAPEGQAGHLGQALASGGKSWARLVGAHLLGGLAFLGSLLLLILPGIWVGLKLSLASYAVILEGRRPADALRRSWQLSEGRMGLLFRANLAAYGLPILVFMAFGLAWMVPAYFYPDLGSAPVPLIQAFLESILLAFSLLSMQIVFEELVKPEMPAADLPAR